MGEEQITKSLNILRGAVNKIYEKQASSLSFEELYWNAYTLVINKHGKTLYKEIIESVKRNILPYLEILKKTEESEYLQKINELWDNHNTSLGMVSDISMYLDKNYVVKEKMKSILESGLLLFKKNIFWDNEVHKNFLDLVYGMIEDEWNGKKIP